MIFQIHVPLWDMTHFFKTPFSIFHKFQSTRPCGTRLSSLLSFLPTKIFQSTRPCGTRLEDIKMDIKFDISWLYFNPRAPVGRDSKPYQLFDLLPISIHAPLWDATLIAVSVFNPRSLFQSTRPCGTRPKKR